MIRDDSVSLAGIRSAYYFIDCVPSCHIKGDLRFSLKIFPAQETPVLKSFR